MEKKRVSMSYLARYLQMVQPPNPAAVAFYASLDSLGSVSEEVSQAILKELRDQRSNLKLIASENYSSLAIQQAMGNLLTDKYSEGFYQHRFYAGCENVDTVEGIAMQEAKKLFGADHAYVQPHSGADANLVAYLAILTQRIQGPFLEKLEKKGMENLTNKEFTSLRREMGKQKILGMAMDSGGHLTHGYRLNISSKLFEPRSYGVNPKTGLVDYDALAKQIKKEKPLILIAGYSSYPRKINFAKMREIADSVGATLFVDMAHFAGLVGGKVFTGEYDPIPYAEIVTTTTHKTLRGPRGGMVLCKEEYKKSVDKGCPLVLGGPLPHVMAAKALCFIEANRPSFRDYALQIVKNASALAEELKRLKVFLLTGGTDNHLMVLDVKKSFGLTGMQAEKALRMSGLTVNRNTIPKDPMGAWFTSGVRIGTPAVTTLGMKEKEMEEIAKIIVDVLQKAEGREAEVYLDPALVEKTKARVRDLLVPFPLYKELVIE